MTNYLLLRDNKQSGPYTFDELKEKGLKAYDLVWIEGKSAAWRYPCEIQELSPFAPQVDEQPFDRFYKKPAQTSDSTPATPAPVRTAPNGAIAATILTGDASSSTAPGRRIIYVTLPAGRTAPVTPPAARETREIPREIRKEPVIKEPAAIPAPVGTLEDIPSHHNEDWKTSVDSAPRTSRKPRSFHLRQTLMVGLTVMALLVAGIFIGLSLNKDSLGINKRISAVNSKDQAVTNPAQPPDNPSPAAVTSTPAAKDNALNKDSIASTTSIRTEPATSSVSPTTTPKTTPRQRERSASAAAKNLTAAPAPKDSSLQAIPAAHRETVHRADITADKVDKDAIRNNLSNLVSIGASGYTVGTFGGISGLQLTVSNRSTYSLDLVVVEVQYIQANKKVFKTENLYFRGIAPGSALMQEAPKSSRGIKVQYKITLVNSKELGLSYSAL